VTLGAGVHRLGPDNADLRVKTYREGLAAKVGHDLVIEVTRWEATVELAESKVELSADPRSLEVREGVRGVKPLTEKDRSEIRRNIDEKVLQGRPISFRSRDVRLADPDGPLVVAGELTMAGSTRPVTATLSISADGRASGTIPLTQSHWGIKPYRGMMGALKVRDELTILIDARLGAG
jgi:polyisoprenoid-binding protein YceI